MTLRRRRTRPASESPADAVPAASPDIPMGEEPGVLQRTPDGHINNCALANGDDVANCQICKGACPDAARFAPASAKEPLRARTERASDRHADAALRDAGIVTTAGDQREKPWDGELPSQSPKFERITERIFDLPDPEGEYKELEDALSEGGPVTEDYTRALDRAEDRARSAHRLFVNAKLDLARFEKDAEVIEGAIRTQATAELQSERDSGVRSKQITNDDVTSKSAALYPDEWRDLAERRTKAKLAVEHLAQLSELWSSRCRSLATLLVSRR